MVEGGNSVSSTQIGLVWSLNLILLLSWSNAMLYSNLLRVKFPCMTIRRILCRFCDFSRARILCAPITTENCVLSCFAEPFFLTLCDVHTLLLVQYTHYVYNFSIFQRLTPLIMQLCRGVTCWAGFSHTSKKANLYSALYISSLSLSLSHYSCQGRRQHWGWGVLRSPAYASGTVCQLPFEPQRSRLWRLPDISRATCLIDWQRLWGLFRTRFTNLRIIIIKTPSDKTQ